VYLALSIVVLSLGGGVAYQWYREHNAPAELVHAEPAPPRAQVKVVEPVVQSDLTAKVAVAPEAEKPAPPEKPALAESPAVEKVTVAKVVPRGGVNRLIIRCEEDAWIEVKDANDRMLVSSLNPKGSERVVRTRGPLSLVIGNARHVQIIHNDKPLDLAPHTRLTIARFTVP